MMKAISFFATILICSCLIKGVSRADNGKENQEILNKYSLVGVIASDSEGNKGGGVVVIKENTGHGKTFILSQNDRIPNSSNLRIHSITDEGAILACGERLVPLKFKLAKKDKRGLTKTFESQKGRNQGSSSDNYYKSTLATMLSKRDNPKSINDEEPQGNAVEEYLLEDDSNSRAIWPPSESNTTIVRTKNQSPDASRNYNSQPQDEEYSEEADYEQESDQGAMVNNTPEDVEYLVD